MAAVAARDMIQMAMQACGVESLDPANAFVTPDELLVILSNEIAETYDLILENEFGDFYRTESTQNLVGNKDTYSFSTDFGITDFYEISGVDVVWSATVVRTAKLFTEAERNRFRRVLPTWSQFTDLWYRPVGGSIKFMPTPLTGIQVVILYIPQFPGFTNDTQTWESFNGWHMMAVYGLCAYIKRKDDDEASAAQFESKKEAQAERIRNMASRRVEGEPPRVQRSRRYDDEDIL